MAQIFSSGTNTLAKLSVVVGAVAPLGIIMTLSGITRSPIATKVGVPYDQPAPFSHEHHANELGIDCRYCHNSVEKAAFANVPPTHTCMSCHSQIWTNSPLLAPVRDSYAAGKPLQWNQLNKVPDFVYFNHSIHINRGINCNYCHGPVQAMQIAYRGKPFFMSWCLDCHRNPENYVRPREEEFNLYVKSQRGLPVGRERTLTSATQITPEEESLLEGREYHRSAEEIKEGKKLVKTYGIKTKELTDCWICHR